MKNNKSENPRVELKLNIRHYLEALNKNNRTYRHSILNSLSKKNL